MLDALYERAAREATPETEAAIGQRVRSRAQARSLDREKARATCQLSQSAPPDQRASRVMQVVREVRTSIGEISRALPDEFRPAHLSVALVDAVFNPQLHYYRQVVPIVERYCDHFGLKRLRDSDDRVPPREAQETLAELIRHYEELGLRRMREEVFRSQTTSSTAPRRFAVSESRYFRMWRNSPPRTSRVPSRAATADARRETRTDSRCHCADIHSRYALAFPSAPAMEFESRR